MPLPIVLRALIDTGADVSCVDKGILAPLIALGLKPNRLVFANVPATGGMGLAGEYALSILIPHPSGDPKSALRLPSQNVIEQPLGSLGYEALLGRNVLERCLLIYDGPFGHVHAGLLNPPHRFSGAAHTTTSARSGDR